jgi:type I restriction enzyme S subunit
MTTVKNDIQRKMSQAPIARLGDFIEECDERNSEGRYGIDDVKGINIEKVFISTVANLSLTDISNYKLVPNGFFACNLMHIGRDIRIPIAFNNKERPQVVSPAYYVFKVKDSKSKVLSHDYLMMIFSLREFDRFCWFATDSSIRGNLLVERFCDIQIPLPSIEVQKELVTVYDGLRVLVEQNEELVEPLSSSCQAFIADCQAKYNSVKLGDFIEECDERNIDGLDLPYMGLNIDKQIVPTVANTEGIDLEKYKVIRNGQFAFSGMQTGRDECIRISLHSGNPVLISPAYTTFSIKKNKIEEMVPQFLFLFFLSPERDRLGWFLSDSSIRSNLDWERFCDIHIPLPPLSVQRSIVNLYKCLAEAKQIAAEAREQLKNICPALVQRARHTA